MSNFGTANEAGEGFVNKVYTGIENFRVVAVCPIHDELKKLYNSDKIKEDTYTLKNEEGKDQVKIVLHLDNEAENGEPSIKTRLTYFITKDSKSSQTGKELYINAYGQNAWLEGGTISKEMEWYEAEGSRLAYDGEPVFIAFIRNLLNLPSLSKATKPEDAMSQFSEADWNAIFNGNFSTVKSAIMSSPNKIGLLLGAKVMDDGKIYQDIYNRSTLRQWAKDGGKFDYLIKDLTEAQQNGSYSKTDFGNLDFKLREYNPDAKGATNESVFKKPQATDTPPKSFFAQQAAAPVAETDDDVAF